MEEKELLINTTPPACIFKENQLNRFSKIFSNMTLACVALIGIALLASLITPLLLVVALFAIFLVALVMIIFTIGLIFLAADSPIYKVFEFMGNVAKAGDILGEISAICINSTKWISLAGIIVSVASIVFVSLSKSRGKVRSIALTSIALIVFLLIFILHLITGGMMWQS